MKTKRIVFALILGVLLFPATLFAQTGKATLVVDLTKYILNGNIALKGVGVEESVERATSKVTEIPVSLTEGTFYTLQIDFCTTEIYLTPGATLKMTVLPGEKGVFNLWHLNFDVAGDNAEINRYLSSRQFEKMEDKDYLLAEDAYLKKLEDVADANKKIIEAFKLSPEFIKKEQFRTRYELLEAVTRYPVQHFWKNGNETFVLYKNEDTPIVKKYLTEQFIDNEKAWQDKAYRKYVTSAIGVLALIDFDRDWDITMQRRLDVLTKYFKTPVILEDMIQHMALTYVEGTEGDSLKVLSEPYKQYVKRTDYHAQLDKARAKWRNFQQGAKVESAEASYVDMEGKAVSLANLKGKYVYIDIWASWCGPCRAEIPFLKELEKKMEGKNICFVSISLDARKNDWAKMVEKQGLKGFQWYGGPNAPIAVDYNITGIPRFLLLDRDGKMLDSNMRRPSDPAIFDFLNGLDGI